ncbi:MAG: hypothetical protein J1F32_01215 [Erysipelotrichales bacterium]|nr:hypothetical protein [Erysipelotrichales bacterium]
MSKLLDEISKYLKKNKKLCEAATRQIYLSSAYTAMIISMYAHRNQKRENGEKYYLHPTRVLWLYRVAIGIDDDYPRFYDIDLMHECNIPFEGVQEVCLLHDVIEDTNITIEDIENIFIESFLGDYFNNYIKEPLLLITHDKSDDYDTYIEKVMKHPISSLVKLMDLVDNSKVSTLKTFGEKEYNRTLGYIRYAKKINDSYHYIENFEKYRRLFKMKKENKKRD